MRGCPMNECYVRDVWSDCVCPVLNVEQQVLSTYMGGGTQITPKYFVKS